MSQTSTCQQTPGETSAAAKVALCACLAILVAFAAVWQIQLRETYSFDYDEGVYLGSARLALAGHSLYGEVFSAQPPAFLELLVLTFRIFGDSLAVGRNLIVGCSLVCLAATGWLAWRMIVPRAAPWAMLYLGVSFPFIRQARTVQSEMPALAFALISMSLLVLGPRRWSWNLFAAGGCFAFAALCKLLVAPMIVPLLFLVWFRRSQADIGVAQAPAPNDPIGRTLHFVLGGLIVTAAAVLPWDLAKVYDQSIRFHLEMKNYFHDDPAKNLALLGQFAIMDLGLMGLALAGIVLLVWRRRGVAGWLFLWFAACAAFVITHNPVLLHHPVLVMPPIALAASSLGLVRARLISPVARVALGVSLLLPLVVCYPGNPDAYWRLTPHLFTALRDYEILHGPPTDRTQEWKMIDLLTATTTAEDVIVSDDLMLPYRGGRRVPPDLCDTSFARINSHFLTNEEAIAGARDARMVIFWTDRLRGLGTFVESTAKKGRLLEVFPEGPFREQRKCYLLPR